MTPVGSSALPMPFQDFTILNFCLAVRGIRGSNAAGGGGSSRPPFFAASFFLFFLLPLGELGELGSEAATPASPPAIARVSLQPMMWETQWLSWGAGGSHWSEPVQEQRSIASCYQTHYSTAQLVSLFALNDCLHLKDDLTRDL